MQQILFGTVRVKLLARAKLIFLREQPDDCFFLWGTLPFHIHGGDLVIVIVVETQALDDVGSEVNPWKLKGLAYHLVIVIVVLR